MRFYILSSLLAVAAFVSASQVDKCKYDVFINAAIDFDLAIQGCPVIAPKVFIISMVCSASFPEKAPADRIPSSLSLKPTSGTPMPTHPAQLETSSREISLFQASLPSTPKFTALRMALCARSPLENQKSMLLPRSAHLYNFRCSI